MPQQSSRQQKHYQLWQQSHRSAPAPCSFSQAWIRPYSACQEVRLPPPPPEGREGEVEFRAFSPLKLLKITLKEVLEVPLEVSGGPGGAPVPYIGIRPHIVSK